MVSKVDKELGVRVENTDELGCDFRSFTRWSSTTLQISFQQSFAHL